jgi:hypothetical protein
VFLIGSEREPVVVRSMQLQEFVKTKTPGLKLFIPKLFRYYIHE